MSSAVAWLDYDEEQQRRTQALLDALSEPRAVDELGLGVLRDAIAGTLHPGMTVLLTRARYLLLVPRAYRNIAGRTSDAVQQAGRKAEIDTAKALLKHYTTAGASADSTGIIGRRKLDDTKRLASTAYWPLLRRLGILTIDGSVADYCRARAAQVDERRRRQPFHLEDEVQVGGACGWVELPDPPAWDGESFELSIEEARFLQQRFVHSEESRLDFIPAMTSVVRWMLLDDRDCWFSGVANVWEHPLVDDLPPNTRHVVWLGEALDRMVHGARILYNFLCSRDGARDDLEQQYTEMFEDWLDEIAQHGFPDAFPLDELVAWASGRPGRNARLSDTERFIRGWCDLVSDGGDLLASTRARNLLRERERAVKGAPRARLCNRSLLTNWMGDSGLRRFDYNWTITGQILADIHRGLGTSFVQVAAE